MSDNRPPWWKPNRRTLTARRRKSGLARFMRRHPIVPASAVLGVGSGFALDNHVVDMSDRAQLYTSAVVAGLTLVGKAVASRRRMFAGLRRGYSAVYVIYGWDPWTDYTTETCIYVGETSQAPWTDRQGRQHWPRLEQHMVGGGRYDSEAKPWADTVTRWCFAHESERGFTFIRMWRERRLVHKLLPIYNYEYNLHNPRRVPILPDQKEQRAERDYLRSMA